MLIEMKNPGLGLPRPKEMSLERGQLRALPVRRGREMAIAGGEADLLNPAAGSVGSWGHQGKVSGRATMSRAMEVAPLQERVVGGISWGTLP